MQTLPGGNVALVCAATRRGRPVVLKTNPRGTPDDAGLGSEGAALEFWRPSGAAIELLDLRDEGFTLLLERAQPGDSLDATDLTWDEKLVVLGELAQRLHATGVPPPGIVLAMSADPPSADDVLLHADLHPGNALRVDSSWKVIDPHGASGDRHAEIWALICPEAPGLPQDPVEARRVAWHRLRIYAEAAGLDPGRAALWTRVRAATEADSPDVGHFPEWAEHLRRTARALLTD